jgi:hypothetical protein
MSGLRFAIEFSGYLGTCGIATGSFICINVAFAWKSFNRIIKILIWYIFSFFLLLFTLFLPILYIHIAGRFPSSIFACNDAAISLVFWVFFVLPSFVISNIGLFIILIIKILRPKKDNKPKDEQRQSAIQDGPSATTNGVLNRYNPGIMA